ncbi:MAG: peptide-methionine (R)-S-oxide reductase MsrB [Gammaproteobacteria bacterium]|nr:peptide-methionine (R)-S-oxide reductase MsrB [Gammaproteobacteria bacterium]
MRLLALAALALLASAVAGAVFYASHAEPVISEISSELDGYEVATFAGGCFWCVEEGFEKALGVKAAISGFSGGEERNPRYENVARGKTGHREVVQVYFDADIITYEGLLEVFWRIFDPTDGEGSFFDRGRQYSPAIFYHNEIQERQARASREALDKSGRFDKPIKVPIIPFTAFYPADEHHQDYATKNPIRYRYYTRGSGRADFVRTTWGSKLEVDFALYRPSPSRYFRPTNEEIKKKLSPQQHEITQEEGTEPPFDNAYWNEKRDGLYVDIVSGEPLFSSKDKFKSGTGWPSFTRPVEGAQIVEKADNKLFMTRIEVRSSIADSHLGHVFDDGPPPTGKRYCINSAALRFIPANELHANGYGEYEAMFVREEM